MTNSRPLSWIDPGRFAGLLARVTDEPTERSIARPADHRTAPPPLRHTIPLRSLGPALPDLRPRRRSNTSLGPPGTTLRPVPPTTPPPAAPSPPAPPPPPRPAEYAAFTAASTVLEDRLQALVAWIASSVPCRAAFIADDNGLPVVEHLATEPGHVAAASSILVMFAQVRTLLSGSGGWLSLELGADVLGVVEVATRWGRFGIGVVTDDALPREFLAALSTAVERAFHADPSQGE